jgi:hypothetical protein
MMDCYYLGVGLFVCESGKYLEIKLSDDLVNKFIFELKLRTLSKVMDVKGLDTNPLENTEGAIKQPCRIGLYKSYPRPAMIGRISWD